MKKIKLIALVLSVVMSVVCCTACNKPATGNGETDELIVYMPGGDYEDLPEVVAKANEIIESKIGAKINLKFINDGDFSEKMKLKMAANEEFDVCFTGYINKYVDGVNSGGFMELDDLIKEEAPALLETMPEFWWDAVKYNGSIYAVPNQQIAASVQALTLPKEFAEKYNINEETVKKMEDLTPFLAQMKADNSGLYVYRNNSLLQPWTTDYETVISNLVIKKGDPEAKLVKIYETPEYKQGLKTMREWFNAGYIRPDVSSVMDDNSDFLAHKYVVTGTTWKPGFEANQSALLGGEHTVIRIAEPYIGTGNCNATMYAISASSKHPEKAIKFIELMNTDKELYNLICYGIEGKHYTKVDENTVDVDSNSGYYPNASWKFGNQFNAYVLKGQSADLWKETSELNDSAETSVLLGFNPNTDDIVTEVSQCLTVYNEFKALEQGSADFEELYAQFVKKMEESGIDKIQEEIQRQINEFLANK